MRRPHVLPLAALVVGAAPAAAQTVPVRTLSAPEAEYAEPFSQINGVRELRDGRVVVSDLRDRTLQLVDLKTGRAQKISREGSGPNEYALPMRMFALQGDTTVVLDPGNQRLLVIAPNGKAVATVPLVSAETRGPDGGRMQRIMSPRGMDARGRIYFQHNGMEMTPEGPKTLDSAAVIRFDPATKKADTLAYLRLAKSNVQTSGSQNNMRVSIGMANPFAAQDDWAVFPVGRVAILRVADYHIDWIAPNKTRTSSAPVKFERVKVTDADKKAWRDNRAGGTTIMMTTAAGPGGTKSSVGTAPPRVDLPEPTDWPAYKPPFTQGAAQAAPNGQLWVLRALAAGTPPTYDVFDPAGRLLGRVVLPKNARLVGFGTGTAYVVRRDEDDLQYLQRYRIEGTFQSRGN